MKYFDDAYAALYIYALWYSRKYKPMNPNRGWFAETVDDYLTMITVAIIWLFIFAPPQAAFYEYFGGGIAPFIISFFYIAIPFVYGIELWETKPWWVWHLYFVAFYWWLTIFRVDTY